MNVSLHSEDRNDYYAIAELNALTFNYGYGMGETCLISLLRNRQTFDPDLSIVARIDGRIDGRIVGHVLFTPQPVLFKGKLLQAVILAPLVVHPEFQNQGIGSKLVEEGIRRCIEKGFDLSLVLGHSEYYSRFGYRPNMWSSASLHIAMSDIPTLQTTVSERRLEERDVPALRAMWEDWFVDSEMAIAPGDSVLDWISCDRGVRASALSMNGELVGYIRYDTSNPSRIISFLAKDSIAFTHMSSYMKSLLRATELETLELPLHPLSKGVRSIVNLIHFKHNNRRSQDASCVK